MFEYVSGNMFYEVTLENGKKCKIASKWIDSTCQKLDIDDFEAVEMWLSDNGYLDEELEQVELTEKAKENKSNKVVNAKNETTKKSQRERVVKANPDKEYIIGCIAEYLEDFSDVSNLVIENKAKLITFTYKNNDYKIDLVQKRKEKAQK